MLQYAKVYQYLFYVLDSVWESFHTSMYWAKELCVLLKLSTEQHKLCALSLEDTSCLFHATVSNGYEPALFISMYWVLVLSK